MFEFVKSMSDVIEDKKEMFGIFSSNPQKTMLIPGLKVLWAMYSYTILFGIQDLAIHVSYCFCSLACVGKIYRES